jgi:hypothetical protein
MEKPKLVLSIALLSALITEFINAHRDLPPHVEIAEFHFRVDTSWGIAAATGSFFSGHRD